MGMERLTKRVQDLLLREPRHQDRVGPALAVFAGCLLLLDPFLGGEPRVSPVVPLAALSMVGLGVAECLPPRWRKVTVALRVACLPLVVAAGAILLAGLIPL